jgi:hypothetical protein
VKGRPAQREISLLFVVHADPVGAGESENDALSTAVVIPSEVRDLLFVLSLAALTKSGMTLDQPLDDF